MIIESKEDNNMKALAAHFSASGVTARVAQAVAEAAGTKAWMK